MRRLVVPALVSVLLLASGCGGSDDSTEPSVQASSEPSPQVEADASYDTVEELRDAAVEAGYDCPEWEATTRVTAASSAGSCSISDLFSVYDEPVDFEQASAQRRRNAERFVDGVAPWLVGPNWIINSDGATALEPVLGGRLAVD